MTKKQTRTRPVIFDQSSVELISLADVDLLSDTLCGLKTATGDAVDRELERRGVGLAVVEIALSHYLATTPLEELYRIGTSPLACATVRIAADRVREMRLREESAA